MLNRVRELREQRGWSQEQLAFAAGVSVSTIQNVEAGRSVRIATVRKLAKALRIPIGTLFELEEAS